MDPATILALVQATSFLVRTVNEYMARPDIPEEEKAQLNLAWAQLQNELTAVNRLWEQSKRKL
jgi:hypothetical protein